jgi:hypothetical protein
MQPIRRSYLSGENINVAEMVDSDNKLVEILFCNTKDDTYGKKKLILF